VELLIQSFELEKNVIPHEEILAFTRFDSYLKSLNELKMNALIAQKLYQDEMENPKAMQSKKNMEMREIEFRLAETSVEKIRADFIRDLYLEKNQLDLEILKTEKELTALENQYDFLVVRAPVDGFVQEVSSLNVGDYLSGNSVVLNIVPNDLKNFRVEIQIPPKDIGKIKVGLKVKYRLSAFPFFEYKGAEGVVTSIDPDIRGAESGNLFYSVYADIDRIEFENNRGEKFPIKAGLETDTRIVLETRNILYFVLKRMDFLC
jgi:multidrug efflux pump subunit AcrA (membrane-fusion protein)